jgi:PAS domain S-box-containing protein
MSNSDNKTQNSYFLNLAAPEVKAALFDAIDSAVFVIDSKGDILYTNQANAKLHEYSQAELIKLNIKDIVSESHLDKVEKRIKTAISFGEAIFESEHRKKTGLQFPVEISYKAITIGTSNLVLGVVRDLTEIKNLLIEKDEKLNESEDLKQAMLNILEDLSKEKDNMEIAFEEARKFKMATDSTSDHIVITDPEGAIIYANRAVEKITGFKNEEIMGKKAGSRELWGGLMDENFYKKLWDVIKIQKKPFSGEIKNKRKSGELYTSFATISPILDSDGNLKFFIGTERDITREKEIDRSKSEFVSLASHQLRTPITAIRWYTENIMDDMSGMNETQKDSVKEVYSAALRMAELVRSLLNVSRIELSTFSIDPKEISLAELVNNILKELDKRIKTKNLNVSFESSLYEDKLNADPIILRILFDNLVSNAIKYTDNGGEVKISLYEKEGYVCFEVKDTGCGIPEKQKTKLFTKFFRADNAVARETDGNGLGLYMVKEIIEKIGGNIYFESAEGKGSMFMLYIPKSGMKKVEGVKQLDV